MCKTALIGLSITEAVKQLPRVSPMKKMQLQSYYGIVPIGTKQQKFRKFSVYYGIMGHTGSYNLCQFSQSQSLVT